MRKQQSAAFFGGLNAHVECDHECLYMQPYCQLSSVNILTVPNVFATKVPIVRNFFNPKLSDLQAHVGLARSITRLNFFEIHPLAYGCSVAVTIPSGAKFGSDSMSTNAYVLDTPSTYIAMLLHPERLPLLRDGEIPVAFVQDTPGDMVLCRTPVRLNIPFAGGRNLNPSDLAGVRDLAKLTHMNELLAIGIIAFTFGDYEVPDAVTEFMVRRAFELTQLKTCMHPDCSNMPCFGRRGGQVHPDAARVCEAHMEAKDTLFNAHSVFAFNSLLQAVVNRPDKSIERSQCAAMWDKLVEFGVTKSKKTGESKFVESSFRDRLVNCAVKKGLELCVRERGYEAKRIVSFARREDLVYVPNKRSSLLFYSCTDLAAPVPTPDNTIVRLAWDALNGQKNSASLTTGNLAKLRDSTRKQLHLAFIYFYKKQIGRKHVSASETD